MTLPRSVAYSTFHCFTEGAIPFQRAVAFSSRGLAKGLGGLERLFGRDDKCYSRIHIRRLEQLLPNLLMKKSSKT